MPKKLYIIRHAKSDWENAACTSDFNRPLNKRGQQAAPQMGKRLANKNLKPQLIITSPALRAFATAKYFAKTWNIKEFEIVLHPEIYEANIGILLNSINKFDNKFDSIAIFGHNPGLTDLVNYLTNSHIANMPTAGVVIIDFAIDNWAMVAGRTGEVVLFDYPKKQQG